MATLHFRKGHVRTLRNIAQSVERSNPELATVMRTAARAAREGTPVSCLEMEATAYADLFERHGAPRPRIVTIGPRGAPPQGPSSPTANGGLSQVRQVQKARGGRR